MRRYHKILIVIFLLCLLFVYNGTSAATIFIYGPTKVIKSPSYQLKRTTYIPLLSVCESHGLIWEWDPIGKVVILKKDNLEARLKVDSHNVYVNGRIIELEKPTLFYRNTVVVPTSFAEEAVDMLFKEWAFPPMEAIPAIPIEGKHTIGTIVIDPGHGGKDPGAVGRYGLMEKDVVLQISKILKKELENSGIRVILTRDKDVFIPLSKRASIANDIRADFFISIHANASYARRAKGFEVYYLSEATDDSARALAAAENASLKYEEKSFSRKAKEELDVWGLELDENRRVSIELADSICNMVSRSLAVRNRGVKSARFYVLNGAIMPAVLVEVGFVSNTNEAQSLNNAYYRKKLAESLADGILCYKREYEKTNGFTE